MTTHEAAAALGLAAGADGAVASGVVAPKVAAAATGMDSGLGVFGVASLGPV